MSLARQIIEAESPKRIFRQISSVEAYLKHNGFEKSPDALIWHRSYHVGRIRVTKNEFYQPPDDHPAPPGAIVGVPWMWNLKVERLSDFGGWKTIENTHYASDRVQLMLDALKTYADAFKTESGVQEAESPKRIFKSITSDRVTPWLRAHGFKPHGNGWQRKTSDWGLPDRQKWSLTVWFDTEAAEWVLKKEGQKKAFGRWRGWHDFGHAVYPRENGDLLVKYLDSIQLP